MSSTDPQLFFWGARGLYLGPAFGLRPHRNAVAVLCAAVVGGAELALDPRTPEAGYVPFRTAIIPPNTLHHLRVPASTTMAFLYVDALSEDYLRLGASMSRRERRYGVGLKCETELLEKLCALRDGRSWRATRGELRELLGLRDAVDPDLRVANALARFRENPGDAHGLDEAADEAQLSPSRFLHLFKQETGVPYRRYRLWTRMGAALKAMRAGSSLTDAAHGAGFASSAHLSASFAEMFGMPPSRLRARPP